MSVVELAETIRRLTGSSSPIRFVERPVDDPDVRRPDTSLAARRLGWRPRIDPETGLLRTIAWFERELGRTDAAAVS
jgi:dTDP-glucose 4,6-dehydratase